MDLLATLDWLASLQRQLAESLCCLVCRVAEHVLFQELIIVVASDKVDSSSAEDSEHNGWFLHSLEALHETVSPAGSAQLGHLLVRSPLGLLDPVAELADAVLVVVVAIALEHEIVAVGKDFWDEAIGVTLAADRAQSGRQEDNLSEVCAHDEGNELICELSHATDWS